MDEEIKATYAAMGTRMATPSPFSCGTRWEANSQYGYTIADGFTTKEQAEAYSLSFYRTRMHLIRQ